jgi:hypothetical protein
VRFGARNDAPAVTFVRGEGVYVWDESGRRYIDMMGAYSAVSFGRCHPRLVKALTLQAQRLDTISCAYSSDRLGPFLARACTVTCMDAALPMNRGAEAVETAIKRRVWAYKVKGLRSDRAEIIAAEGNFHGRTNSIGGFSSVAQYRDGFGTFPPGFKLVPFGDAAALATAITPDTAAFLIEVFLTSWDSPFVLEDLLAAVLCQLPLGTNHNPIFDFGDAGRRPGDALRFLPLNPGANGAFQCHLTSVRFDGDSIGVHLGISLECFHDLALKL